MADGLFTEHLESLDPAALPLSYPSTMSRNSAALWATRAPSNQQVLDACKAAYGQHTPAVDQVAVGSIDTARAPDMQPHVAAMNSYDWSSRVAAPSLTSPVLDSPSMATARAAVMKDQSFLTFFMGIEANIDVIVGGVGGIGVGFPFPDAAGSTPLWMAWGGLRIALNIDVAINLTAGVFLEPPSKVAGDYLGIELSAEPVAEGPSVSFGIHMSTDLSEIRGFSIGVGLELGILPVTAAVVYGTIATS